MIEDIFLTLDYPLLISIFLGVAVCYFLLIRKAIFTWFDPLFSFYVFNSCSIALVIYLFAKSMISAFYFYTFIASIVAFIAGLRLGNVRRANVHATISADRFYHYAKILDIFLFLCVLFLVVSNLLLFAIKGTVPILSANPGDAKILLFQGGWGIVRRFNMLFTKVIFAIVLVKLVNPVSHLSRAKLIYLLVCFLLTVMVIMTTGSKGALLMIVGIFFPVYLINKNLTHLNAGLKLPLNDHLKTIKRVTFWGLMVSVLYLFLVLVLTFGQGSALTSLAVRFVASGDIYYFYYTYNLDHYFRHGPADYVLNFLNSPLGMFHIVPYEYTIGSYSLFYSTGLKLSSFGPNAQHPIEGLVYFGPYFAWLYSFLVGLLISSVRTRWLFHILKRPNQFNLMLYVIFCSMIVTYAIESSLFASELFDLIIYALPIFLLSMAINFMLEKKPVVYAVQ